MEDEAILFALLDAPDGLNSEQLCKLIGAGRDRVRKSIRRLRQDLSGDTYTVIVEPNGTHQPWIYKVTSTPEDAREWQARRVGDLEARIETDRNVALSLVNATDGRSTEGKRVRLIALDLQHLIEKLQVIDT
jgi:hypothetical protein